MGECTRGLKFWRDPHEWNGTHCERCGVPAPRCGQTSGSFYGHPCGLRKGHAPGIQHQVVTRVGRTNGRVTSVSRTRWGEGAKGDDLPAEITR